MSPTIWLASLSALFFLTSLGITLKQRRAASCPRHERAAGVAAEYLALACLVVSLLLGGMALYPLLARGGP
jgi:SNF family Na+-dependent transporter